MRKARVMTEGNMAHPKPDQPISWLYELLRPKNEGMSPQDATADTTAASSVCSSKL